MKNCEYCGRLHNGKYGSGRFCCQECARGFSTKAKRKEINKKVSATLKSDKLLSEKTRAGREKAIRIIKQAKLARRVRISGIDLDITYGELEEYRKTHPVCEICGNQERRRAYKGKDKPDKLCIDHDHKTGKFRGLLCSKCNYNLGWFEGEKEKVQKYIGE